MHIDIYPDGSSKVRDVNGDHACFNIYNKMIDCFKGKDGKCGDHIKKWDACIRKVEESKKNLTK